MIPQEVFKNIDRTLIEISVTIVGVTSFFVRIDGPVNEINYFVFNLYYTDTLRVEVIGHVLITSDIHKSAIHSKKRI